MATSTNTYNINVNANQAQQALTNLQTKLETVNGTFDKLKNAITGLALGGFIANAYAMADAISDVADASGLAVASVLGFSSAIKAAGGSSEGALTGIARFGNTLSDAIGGNKQAQDSLRNLGVTLDDLRNASEQDILKKTIQGLAALGPGAEATAKGVSIFGKSFASVNFKDVNANLDEFIRKAQEAAPAIVAAAKAQDQFDGAVKNLQTSLLLALQPINEFISSLDPNAIKAFADAIINLGTVFAALFVATRIGTAIESLVVGMRAGALAAGGLSLSMAASVSSLANFRLGLQQIGQAFDLNSARTVAAGTGFSTLNVTLKSLATGFLRLLPFVGQVAAAFVILNSVIEMITGNSIIDWAQEAAKALGLISETSKDVELKLAQQKQAEEELAKQKEKRKVQLAYQEKEIQGLDQILAAYKQVNSEANKRFELETKNIGASEEQRSRSQMLFDAESKYNQERIKLQDKLDAARKSESPTERDLIPELESRLKSLSVAYREQIGSINDNVSARETSTRANNLELLGTRSLVENNKKLADIQNQIANTGLPKLTQQTNAITQAMNASAEAAIAEEEARRKQKLDPAERQEYYNRFAAGVDKVTEAQIRLNAVLDQQKLKDFALQSRIGLENDEMKLLDNMVKGPMNDLERAQYDILAAARNRAKAAIDAYEAENGVSMAVEQQAEYYKNAATGAGRLLTINEKVYNQSRTFASGWNKAFKQYVDDANNAAKSAERIFNKAFQGIEDVLVDFVKTGKFEWKNFVSDMAEELLRSQIKQLLGGLGSALGLGNLGGGGALGDSPTNPLYVMDISGGGGSPFANYGAGLGGIEGMFSGMGLGGGGFGGGNPMISGGGFGGMVGGQQGGFGGISNIFGGISNTIGSVVGGISDAVGSVWDTVSGLFDGFFANGGQIGAGKFGVVGERGPEFVSGPATVTPMMGSNVTYNINAVDAMSFKQMIAQDPSFIHAVAMQGAKGIPGRY
jgi:lambda family phage tail tape measure protein